MNTPSCHVDMEGFVKSTTIDNPVMFDHMREQQNPGWVVPHPTLPWEKSDPVGFGYSTGQVDTQEHFDLTNMA